MGRDIYSLSAYSGSASSHELFLLENLLEESKHKDRNAPDTSRTGVHALDDRARGILTL